jgi:hypothetical protein
MHSDVGPYFTSDAIFHLHPTGFEIEEAYITSKKLPANLQLKAGRFSSSVLSANEIIIICFIFSPIRLIMVIFFLYF